MTELEVLAARFLANEQTLIAPGTLQNRTIAVKAFLAWCGERSMDQATQITRPVLERYRRHLFYHEQRTGQPLSLATQRNRLHGIKRFCKWLAAEYYLPHNPASELAMPRPHKRLPRAILTHEEVEAVIRQTHKKGEIGIRDRAIIETFYASGIRRNELVNLSIYDIDTEQHTLMIREGKGKKDRLLPIGERACQWVGKYLTDIRPELITRLDETVLFLTDYGEPFIKGRLTPLIKTYLKQAGIDKPGACHLFRHTMATQMLDNGADLRFIQAMLGHADISTTTIYTQVSIKKLREVYDRTHPVRGDRKPDDETREVIYDALDEEDRDDPE